MLVKYDEKLAVYFITVGKQRTCMDKDDADDDDSLPISDQWNSYLISNLIKFVVNEFAQKCVILDNVWLLITQQLLNAFFISLFIWLM